MKKVSIIIPTYNVEKYIEKCIHSFLKQTYSNFEIIIVDDCSTDNTFKVCSELTKKDSRILCVRNSNNMGAGSSRNQGLLLSEGDYVIFSDADDWVSSNYVETLVAAIDTDDVELVSYSSIDFVKKESSERRHRMPAGIYTKKEEKSSVLLGDFSAVWKKIYKRKMLIDNNLFMPELSHSEDCMYEMVLIPFCKKIKIIQGSGVFYRTNRENSLMACKNLVVLAKQFEEATVYALVNCIEWSKNVYLAYVMRHYNSIFSDAIESGNIIVQKELRQFYESVIKVKLGEYALDKYCSYIIFGSYNLVNVARAAGLANSQVEYYGFSSIVAAMTIGDDTYAKHKNSFRNDLIRKDASGEFAKRINDIEKKTLLLVDFIEEQNQVNKDSDNYITLSESFLECNAEEMGITLSPDDFAIQWKEKCNYLIKSLKEKKENITIVLVKNRFSLLYGDKNKLNAFENTDEINRNNQRIEMYEKYLVNQCYINGIDLVVIDVPKEYYFTDLECQYGCTPYYTNWMVYSFVAQEIIKRLPV